MKVKITDDGNGEFKTRTYERADLTQCWYLANSSLAEGWAITCSALSLGVDIELASMRDCFAVMLDDREAQVGIGDVRLHWYADEHGRWLHLREDIRLIVSIPETVARHMAQDLRLLADGISFSDLPRRLETLLDRPSQRHDTMPELFARPRELALETTP